MGKPREPLALILAKGKKHLTKAEIEQRQAAEPKPCTEGIEAPAYLTAKQKKTFNKLAVQLETLGVMGETDNDALARYITAQELYEQAVRDLRAAQKHKPPKDATAEAMAEWAYILLSLDKRQDRYFKQANTAARELGLTISGRCKLVVPATQEEPKVNKFNKFGARTGSA